MADLNRYLVNELAVATEGGRELAFHMSPSLLNAMHQVQSHGTIANSFNDGWEFLELIDAIGIQFHSFNTSKVAAIDMQEYDALDPSQKVLLTAIMEYVLICLSQLTQLKTDILFHSEVIGEDTLMVHQNGRFLVGPLRAFQYYDPITGTNAVRPGSHPIIPDFQLPANQTWVQVGSPNSNDQISSQSQDAISTDEFESVTTLKQRRVPRPPNPFIIYRSERHKTVAEMHPDLSNNEICKFGVALLLFNF